MSPKALLLALTPLALAGCGLSPMYAGGGQGAVARSLAGVDVSAIEGKAGWLVRAALVDKLGAGAASTPRYRLDVRLDEQLQGLGLLAKLGKAMLGRLHPLFQIAAMGHGVRGQDQTVPFIFQIIHVERFLPVIGRMDRGGVAGSRRMHRGREDF